MINPEQEEADVLSSLGARPLPGLPPTFAERFVADATAAMRFDSSIAAQANRHAVVQNYIDQFEDMTGEILTNPEASPLNSRDRLWGQIRERFRVWNENQTELAINIPDDDGIQREADERALSARREAQKLAVRPQTFASSAGGVLGGIAGTMTDPLNIATLTLGAPARLGILGTAAVEGAIGVGTQTAIEALTYGYKSRVDPTFGPGDSATNIIEAGVGGAVIGGGIKGLIEATRFVAKRVPSRDTQDALNVLEREAALDDANPNPPTDLAGYSAHRQTMDQAIAAVEEGRIAEVREPYRSVNILDEPSPVVRADEAIVTRETPEPVQRAVEEPEPERLLAERRDMAVHSPRLAEVLGETNVRATETVAPLPAARIEEKMKALEKSAAPEALDVEIRRLLPEPDETQPDAPVRDFSVPVAETVVDGKPMAETRSARQLLADMDREIAGARAIAVCSIGGVA